MRLRFISNKDDNNHCLQASLMMAVFATGHFISWDDIDRVTSYEPNLYTWASTVVVPFSEIVSGVRLISTMNYKTFSEQGELFLKEVWTPEWFSIQQAHASAKFKKEQDAARKAIDRGLILKENCDLAKIEDLLKDNFIIALIDSGKLEGGYRSSAHYVFVYKSDNQNFELHDPGLPGHKKWLINKNKFYSAFHGDVIVIPRKDYF